MLRRHPLLFIILLLIKLPGFPQNVKDSIAIEKFGFRHLGKANNNYILLYVSTTSPLYLKNRIALQATRQLSGTIFILEKEKLKNFIPGEAYFKKYNLINDHWKLSPAADEVRILKSGCKPFRFLISYKSDGAANRILKVNPSLKKHSFELLSQKMLSVVCTYTDIENVFLHNDEVLFIDVNIFPPKEETAIGGFDLSANKINQVHSRYPLINGLGQHVSIKENYYDTTDIDLKGRLEFSPLASAITTNHANFMATIIAGAGNSVYYAKGAAWAAGISSSSFEPVLPDPTSYYIQNNITVQNHSYGTAIDNSYGLNAVAFDKSANEDPLLLHVFSSGNAGDATSTSGPYSGIPRFANLTGNFKMAKNIIIVGSADSFGTVSPLSSRGPAYDGRIKPELIAFEKSGTSEAAALVSGTTLLLQQYYKNKNGTALPSAFAKAILINAADDVNNLGPDHATGFGNLNAIKAMDIIKENTLLSGSLAQNNIQSFTINIPPNISQVKITLAWNDTAATAFNPKALVNDLDLTLSYAATNEVWQPWVLSSFPHIDSLNKLPQRKRDSLNNVEQVTLQNPAAGNYQIKVHGFNVPSVSQKFYVAYSMDTANNFKWMYPSNIDFLETGRENIFRWESNIAGTGDIEYTIVPSNTWRSIVANTDLTKKYFKWTPPDTTVQSLVRMKIGNTYFYSDTFLIAGLPTPKVGFVCRDTILLFWNRIKGVSQYQVYQLGNRYMDPLVKVADTAVLLPISSLSEKYFSVGTVLPNNVPGPKGYAFNYTLQGTGCYIKTFFADANGNVAKLNLLLGTTYKISNIIFQVSTTSGFITIDSFPPLGQTSFIYNYQPLVPGITSFRTKITLQSGEIIYSDVVSVFYVEPGKYIFLP
ncbi:MAG TPA: S8 family serine peptidase, partial [Chitinophagaceae bacterium]|nr:S8 family serine peptidase [Chitinophagaceae bacterium]